MASDTAYNRSFFERQRSGSLTSARIIVPLIMRLTAPKSVVSVGCGTGAWLSVFKEHGVEKILGFDGSYVDRTLLYIPPDCFRETDLSGEFSSEESFDLVECLEVAEHLPKSAASRFVRSLVRLAPVVLFSAAIPLQGGVEHMNEQWPEYWKGLFQEHGYRMLDPVRKLIWKNNEVRWWYRQNIFLFVLEDAISRFPLLSEEARQADDLMLVHRDILYAHLGLGRTIKRLPSRVCGAIAGRVAKFFKSGVKSIEPPNARQDTR